MFYRCRYIRLIGVQQMTISDWKYLSRNYSVFGFLFSCFLSMIFFISVIQVVFIDCYCSLRVLSVQLTQTSIKLTKTNFTITGVWPIFDETGYTSLPHLILNCYTSEYIPSYNSILTCRIHQNMQSKIRFIKLYKLGRNT